MNGRFGEQDEAASLPYDRPLWAESARGVETGGERTVAAQRMEVSNADSRVPSDSAGLRARQGHQIFGYKACTARGRDEGAARGSNGTNAVDCRVEVMQGAVARLVRHRPFSGQPVFGLLKRREFLHIAIRRRDKGQGFPPVEFYQNKSFLKDRATRILGRAGSSRRQTGPVRPVPPAVLQRLSSAQRQVDRRFAAIAVTLDIEGDGLAIIQAA